MDTSRTHFKVHQCSKCLADTDNFCVSCSCDLCSECKENHLKDLKTIDHSVVIYRDKDRIQKQEIYDAHSNRNDSEPRDLPVGKPRQLNIKTTYEESKRLKHEDVIQTIKNEALFYIPILLSGVKADVKTCQTELSLHQSDVLKNVQRLTDLINYVLSNFMDNVFCDFLFKHRCLKQKLEIKRNVAIIQGYEQIYEQSAIKPVKFVSLSKTFRVFQLDVHFTLHTNTLFRTELPYKKDVMKSLEGIKIITRGKRRIGNERLLELMPVTELHQSFTVKDVDGCFHISSVTSNRFWVSDRQNNLILKNTSGDSLHHLKDSCSENGSHTTNSQSELIYISRNHYINKLSNNLKTTTTILVPIDSVLRPQCVYCSPATGDLLVGMYSNIKANVKRYTQAGQLTQTIQHGNTELELYSKPCYITENNNGDVVVSDLSAVVVTERGGRHRFSYKGNPSGSGITPRGICTDALSHIIVCDYRNRTVHMIDKNGQFLSHLMIRPLGIYKPLSLGYDINTHRLMVGSEDNNKVCVYRYITRQSIPSDFSSIMPKLTDTIHSTEAEQKNERCLLKIMSSPELLLSLKVQNVYGFYHISHVTPDRAWVSDTNSLNLTNAIGDNIHQLEDLCSAYYNGLHTVNNERELIYVTKNYNINILSDDMKTTTTFIETTDSNWKPQCVHWSSLFGDLLVGVYNESARIGQVTRYYQTGRLKQTIQHDNNELELYVKPCYITENNNGDVVVSDSGAVVVTERGGRHRFYYTGHPPGSGLDPRGICTDALSHILVCDFTTNKMHLIDRDGQFLLHLSIRPSMIFRPLSLSYDVNTNRLWVGSQYNNELFVYRYITRQDSMTDEHAQCLEGDALSSSS